MTVIKQIQNGTQPIQTVNTSEDFFDENLPPVSIDDLINQFTDLAIRFDNDPNYYTKKDYYYLLKYLGEIIRQLKNKTDDGQLQTLNNLLQSTISELRQVQSDKQNKQSDNLETQADTIEGAINELNTWKEGAIEDLGYLAKVKQDKEDKTLKTNSKTIVGAINELYLETSKQGWLLHDGFYRTEELKGSHPSHAKILLTDSLPSGTYKISATDSITALPFTQSCIEIEQGGLKQIYSWGASFTINQPAKLWIWLADYDFVKQFYDDADSVSEVYYENSTWSIKDIWLQQDIEQVTTNIQSIENDVETVTNNVTVNTEEISILRNDVDGLLQGGGSVPAYTEGSGIYIEDSTIKSVYTGDDFTVNVNIGSLKAGETKIEKGSNIVDILRQMLTKYIKCVIKSQTAVSFANQSKTVEYNGSINVTVTPKVTYGKVESEDPNYVPENTTITQEIDTDKPYSDLALGWSQNGSNLVKTFSNVVNQITNSNIAKCHLTPNSTPIKDNMGNEQEDLTIAEMVTISGQVTITPQQYVYYGFIDNSKIGGNNVQISNITDIMVKDLNRITKNYPVAVFTQTANLSTEGGQSLVIAVPSNRTLDKMVDQNNADIKSDHPNFQTKTIALDYSGAPVNYNVYLYPLRDPFTCNTFKLS